MANFSLTVLEYSALQLAEGKGSKRKMAANYYQIEEKVLDRVGELSSTKGGSVARKAEGAPTHSQSRRPAFSNRRQSHSRDKGRRRRQPIPAGNYR